MISQECSVPAFSCQTLQPGTDASTVSAHEISCATSPRHFLQHRVEPLLSWAYAPSGFFFRRILRKAPSFPLPLSSFFHQPPKMPMNGTSGDSFRRLSLSLFSKGTHPLGVSDRLSPATSLEHEPTTAYFFSLGFRTLYSSRSSPLCGRFHPA
jgi:hypothetical protein